jgi:GTP cyclohydrolase I
MCEHHMVPFMGKVVRPTTSVQRFILY